jgi:hypothetical protein
MKLSEYLYIERERERKRAIMRHTGRLDTSATYGACRHEIHRYVCIIHAYIYIYRHVAYMYTYTLVH